MSPHAKSIFDDAMALPEAERALLLERLLEVLSPDEEELIDDELASELDRRRAQVEQGLVKPIPWSDACFDE